MADNHFSSTMETLFKGLEQFVTTKTVVGEPVQAGDVTIIPLIDVTCGMGAGAFSEGTKQKQNGGGGMSAKMSPLSLIHISSKPPEQSFWPAEALDASWTSSPRR